MKNRILYRIGLMFADFFDIFGTFTYMDRDFHRVKRTDAEAIASYWKAVGDYMWKALGKSRTEDHGNINED